MKTPRKATRERIGAILAALSLEDLTTTDLSTVLGYHRTAVRSALDYATVRGWVVPTGQMRRRKKKTVGRPAIVWTLTDSGRSEDAGWVE